MLPRTLAALALVGSLAVGTEARAHPAAEPPRSERRSGAIGLTAAGFGILAINYATVAGVIGSRIRQSEDPEYRRLMRPMLVPVVGPFVSASRATAPGPRFGFVTVGILQTALLGLGAAGAAILGQEEHRRAHAVARSVRLEWAPLRLRF